MLAQANEAAVGLPVELTRFVGRRREAAEVRRLLGQARLLTLIGAGGVGKTRLALHVAAGVASRYRDGTTLIELAALADPDRVPQAVLAALGLRTDPGGTPAEKLRAYLCSRQALLLVDNCEHVLAGAAPLVHDLLVSCPDLQVLATSREPLGLAGEVAWRVPSLSLPPEPDPADDPAELDPALALESEAVQLFAERASAALPGFQLTDQNVVDVVQICARLDGIPLAIELAAAWSRMLAPRQIAARLDNAFALLVRHGGGTVPRHQTLRALVDWSYALLSESERRLLQRLSVFAGGWTLDAAEAVCAGDGIDQTDVLGLLSQLVDKSLVAVEPGPFEARYRLLETLRQYGAEQLDASGDEARVRSRHLAWYAEAIRRSERVWAMQMGDLLRRFEREHDNLRAALTWACDGPDREEGLSLAAAGTWFWYMAGHLAEGWGWLARLLRLGAEPDAAITGEPTETRARGLTYAGFLAMFRDPAAALRLTEAGVEMARRVDDGSCLARALTCRGMALHYAGRSADAKLAFVEAIPLARAVGDLPVLHDALYSHGFACQALGQLDEAIDYLEQTVALGRQTGGHWHAASALRRLAQVAMVQGDLDRAETLLRESLPLHRAIRERAGITYTLEAVGALAFARRDPHRAVRLAGAVDRLREATGARLPVEQAVVDRWLAPAREALGPEEAARVWAEGRTLALEDAVEYALDAPPPAPRAASPSRLSERERQVAALIARDYTNRQIAAELVITEGTAKRHVENILTKLDLRSRHEIATWAVREGLGAAGAT